MLNVIFTPQARERFADIKRLLQEEVPQPGEALRIWRCGQLFHEVLAHEYYQMDDTKDISTWAHEQFGIGQHQVAKYLDVYRLMTTSELAGRRGGVEVVYQIAKAPVPYRDTLWDLLQRFRYGAGPLSAGRQAAGGREESAKKRGKTVPLADLMKTLAAAAAARHQQEMLQQRAQREANKDDMNKAVRGEAMLDNALAAMVEKGRAVPRARIHELRSKLEWDLVQLEMMEALCTDHVIEAAPEPAAAAAPPEPEPPATFATSAPPRDPKATAPRQKDKRPAGPRKRRMPGLYDNDLDNYGGRLPPNYDDRPT